MQGGIFMKFKIGFQGYEEEKEELLQTAEQEENIAVRSVVQVHFPDRGRAYAYYNDKFDLHKGDAVFVEGKLEGVRGIVTEVNRSFRIRLSDYKRVIAVADTDVKGELYFGGSHLLAFDERVIPYEKIRTWYLPPESDDEIAVGSDDEGFFLARLEFFRIRPDVAERGFDYYNFNKVVYLSVNGTSGRAIVQGSQAYEVSFDFIDGEIRNLTCGCWCSYHCKHEYAVLLQLRDILEFIEENYGEQYEQSGYFAAVSKSELLSYSLRGNESGKIALY